MATIATTITNAAIPKISHHSNGALQLMGKTVIAGERTSRPFGVRKRLRLKKNVVSLAASR